MYKVSVRNQSEVIQIKSHLIVLKQIIVKYLNYLP